MIQKVETFCDSKYEMILEKVAEPLLDQRFSVNNVEVKPSV